MKSRTASIGVALAIVAGFGVNGVFAQQVPSRRRSRPRWSQQRLRRTGIPGTQY